MSPLGLGSLIQSKSIDPFFLLLLYAMLLASAPKQKPSTPSGHHSHSHSHSLPSLLQSTATFSPETATFLIDSAASHCLSYSQFLHQSQFPSLSRTSNNRKQQNVQLIISPPSFHVPVLSLYITISPANPLSTPPELTHIVQLSKPVIAFATSSATIHIPSLPLGTLLVDSPQFLAMLNSKTSIPKRVSAAQSDSCTILYSSGTTGRVKGVELTHRNLITIVAGFYRNTFFTAEDDSHESPAVSLFSLPLFHAFGFFMLIRAFAAGESLVLMGRFDFETMLKAVEKYKVTYMRHHRR